MPVNPEETSADIQLMEALNAAEQEPTADDDVAPDEGDEEQADATDEVDEDADLDDDADAEEGEDGEDGTSRYTVKVNGQEAKVTLNELKEGYMKDADYRRKTAEISATRKRAEAVEAQYSGGLKQLEGQLELVATFLANQLNVDEEELDKLAAEKPAEFVARQRQMAKQGNALRNVDAQLQGIRREQAEAAQRKMVEFRNTETAKLQEVAPEFRKPEATERLHSYLKDTYGLQKDEIESVVDHRFALIADKARRFDALKAKASLKDKQVRKDPAKFQKGGVATRTNNSSKAREQTFGKVMTSGRVDDLAALF